MTPAVVTTFAALFFLLTAGSDCDNGVTEEELSELESAIMEMIGEAPADTVAACRVIAFGSKPCGGPWRYLVYSAQHTDSTALEQLVREYNRLDDRRNRELGLVSDCALVTRPDVALSGDGHCVSGR